MPSKIRDMRRSPSVGALRVAACALWALASLPVAAGTRKVEIVADVGALYAAVNDSRNEGALVVLAAGTYRLDAGAPNGGRLELQAGMGLQGYGCAFNHYILGRLDAAVIALKALACDPERVVIDASGLPSTSYAAALGATGAVRAGRGENSIAGLAVQNARNGASAITTDLVAPGPARLAVLNIVVRGSTRGLDVRNVGAEATGRALDVEIAHSAFVDNVTGPGQGLRFANVGTSGATIRATLVANRSQGNTAGCLATNVNSSGGTIAIRSIADDFVGNGNGCVFVAGTRQALPAVVGNVLTVDAVGSRFAGNTLAPSPAFPEPGGILAFAALNTDSTNSVSDNTLAIRLTGVRMSDNGGDDVRAYGAYSSAMPPQPAGTHNATSMTLVATTGTLAPPAASVPPEPAHTNTVTINGR
jgi:hypothetical protein